MIFTSVKMSTGLRNHIAAACGGAVPELSIVPPDMRQGGAFVARSLAKACATLAADNQLFATSFNGAQGAEAALKAILNRHGYTKKQLEPIRHDLEQLWGFARGVYQPLGDMPDWLKTLAPAHKKFQLRYHDEVHGMQYPGEMKVAQGMQDLVAHMELALA